MQSEYPPELVAEALSYSQETIDRHPDWLTRAILNDARKPDPREPDFRICEKVSCSKKAGIESGEVNLLKPEQIQAIIDLINMPEEDYNMMKVVSPNVAHAVDMCRKVFLENPLENKNIKDHKTPVNDVADQIRKLADLKNEGILTEEEFITQKRKLLGL